jgi:arylsulfatase A-like enzyme
MRFTMRSLNCPAGWLFGLAGLCALIGLSCGEQTARPTLHVLLITVDTMRADRLGFDGYARPTSPQLDALAQQSTVFAQAIAQAAVTPVSHASILTGQNPYRHGLRVLHGHVANRLEESAQTLAEVWRAAGGQTAAFVSAFPATASFGLDQGFDHFDAQFQQSDGKGLVSPTGVVVTGMSQRGADETTRAAIDWLRDRDVRRKPLFLWVHYFDPHDANLTPPPEWLNAQLASAFPPASARKDDYLRAVYDAETCFMDAQIGRLVREFQRRGLWEHTLLVLVGDHGQGLGDHNWWGHGILYQEQVRVPMFIRWPGVAAGQRVDDLVRTIDLMPTILEAAGVSAQLYPVMDGISLGSAIHTGRVEPAREAYSESVNMLTYGRPDSPNLSDPKTDKLYCLMTGDHKLIYHQLRPEETEFYDLAADPLEEVNLASVRPAAMDSLTRRLEALAAFSPIMPNMTTTDYERLERLRSLGYIQ